MKLKTLPAIALAAAACVMPFAYGCSSDYETQRALGSYMGTDASLVLTTNFNDEEVEALANELWAETKSCLSQIERSISVNVESSYISKFNAADAGEKVQLDETSYTVLSLAKEVYELTGGYYNPAVYYSVDLYGFSSGTTRESMPYDRDSYTILPDEKYITAFQTLSGSFSQIILESADGGYYATKPQTTVEVDGAVYALKIDLGGIGKGYAADIVGELITNYGFEYGYFNFGSSSIAVKNSYETEDGKWNLSFRDPRGSVNDSYLSAYVSDCCLSSSGDYEQYYLVDGVRYCHIIDPMTGSPIQTGIITATVIGGTAAENDALTTAIMAMGLEKAVDFINEELTGKKVVFVYESGENRYVIANDTEYFTITAEGYALGNTVEGGGKPEGSGKIVLNNDVA